MPLRTISGGPLPDDCPARGVLGFRPSSTASRVSTPSRHNSKGSVGCSPTFQAASNALLTPLGGRTSSRTSIRDQFSALPKTVSEDRADSITRSLPLTPSKSMSSLTGRRVDSLSTVACGSLASLSPSSSVNGVLDASPSDQASVSPSDAAWRSPSAPSGDQRGCRTPPEFDSSACRLGMLMARRQTAPDISIQTHSPKSSSSNSPKHRNSTLSPTGGRSSPSGRRSTDRWNRRCSLPHLGFMLEEPQMDIRRLGPDEKIFDLYHWSEVLQESGDGGKVVVCQSKGNQERGGRELVLKMRSKESLQNNRMEEQFRNAQVRLLNMPAHPGIVTVHEVLEDSKFYYMLMEKGTSFFDGLMSQYTDGIMPPGAVKRLVRDILEAVEHVHQQGMLHRDIKPDNLVMRLVDDETSPGGRGRRVALIDFDHAEIELDNNGESDDRFCGTYQFSAPETFLGHFSRSSDLYSVGVTLYLLMAGKMPYDHPVYADCLERNRFPAVHKSMKETRVDWQCSPWPEQPLCRGFCQWLLEFDPAQRCPSSPEAMKHEWLAKYCKNQGEA